MSQAAPAASDRGPLRIAMWSGPRNLSTALMRSFGNRPDCAVVDEPFYAAFLALSGADHPMREAIVRRHEADWRRVAASLAADPPDGKPVFYQKHMTHHMLPEIGREWMRACRHAFLIRHPARVLASYAAKRERVEFADIGFAEQLELFHRAADLAASPPPVIDADRLLGNPRAVLASLCNGLGLAFSETMLWWPAGLRATDGIWASHWYDAVARSTGFSAPAPLPTLEDPHLVRVCERAMPIYERLAAHAEV